MSDVIIIGAGLAGLAAACKFPGATIYESGARGEKHKAVLRFRDKSVSELTGIPFKEVTVRKEIYLNGGMYNACSISAANMYSRKVAGIYEDRSIWDLAPSKRYIAPENFYDRLVDMSLARGVEIHWNFPVSKDLLVTESDAWINTAPLPVIMDVVGMPKADFNFEKSAIHVDRYRLPKGSDVYQTIYFPQMNMRVYRASITGDVLTVESLGGDSKEHFEWPSNSREELSIIIDAFGLDRFERLEFIDSADQKYGKIVDLPRNQREAILYELTREFNIFSLGRFATWRNLLLDDVVKDLNVIERLMTASSYGRELVLARR
jgi:hypothetical protein